MDADSLTVDGSALEPVLEPVLDGQGEVPPRKERRPCRYHQKRYLLPGSPMCVHPDCLRTFLYITRQRSNYIRTGLAILHEMHMVEDFVQHMVVRYLEQLADGKRPAIRPLWIMYEIGKFINKMDRAYVVAPVDMGPSGWVDGDDWEGGGYLTASDVEKAVAAHFSEVDGRFEGNGYRRMLYEQVSRYMRAEGFDLQLLTLRDDVSISDAWLLDVDGRADGLTLVDAHMRLAFVADWVAFWAAYYEEAGDATAGRRRGAGAAPVTADAELGVGLEAGEGESGGDDGRGLAVAGDGVDSGPGRHGHRGGRAAGKGEPRGVEVHPRGAKGRPSKGRRGGGKRFRGLEGQAQGVTCG